MLFLHDAARHAHVTAQQAEDPGLQVLISTVPNAGKGLFTTREFAAGAVVCCYTGTFLDGKAATAARTSGDPARTAYLMRLAKGVTIDAGPHPGVFARYINDNADKARLNVRFEKDPANRLARVIAARALAPGEELFVSYGAGYWKQHPGVFTSW